MDWGKIFSAAAPIVGKVFSGGSHGMEADREAQNRDNVGRDRTMLDAIGERERAMEARRRLEMDQRELDMKTRDSGYNQALRAQYLQGWSPAQRPSRIPMVHGGFNTIPQSARDLAQKFEQDATVRALQGQKFDDMPAMERFTPTPVKQPSLWERITGFAGLGLSGASAIQQAMNGGGNGGTPTFSGIPRPSDEDFV